ncbi:MAG: hypothetical protein KBF12_04530 [Sebaldella sp.]|nr:hypothetical protein [Sebaldella sp.]
MKKIKIFLEYRCYPMWIYNENGELVDNNLLEELNGDNSISKNLKEIQESYDALFEDNDLNFEFKGFSSEVEKLSFLTKIDKTIELIKVKIGNNYTIENKAII